MAAGVVVGGVLIGLVWLIGGRISALWAAAGIAIAVGGAALVLRQRQRQRSGPGRRLGRAGVSVVVLTAVLAVGLVSWVGANDPTVQWFGHVVTHGDRTQRRVALTFDDGPDDPYTMDVSRILDDHGVKGTFFEVGKAVDARPEISRALRDDGQLRGESLVPP